ncbi:MAG: PilZ domain-containing protein [Xanthobacteraceae bacterium]|uniref:PilZ domain-containing protein n=1 Tax=Pseudolabrys sp. TaxID=1960880 RepID=UPI003D0F1EF6
MTVVEDDKTVVQGQVERRRIRRHRTLKGGSIAFNSGARFDCRVRNLSPLGACLEVESSIGVPDTFVLLIDSEHARYDCRVVWREPKRLGVEFPG